MRTADRLSKLEREAAEAGLAELTELAARTADAIVACLADAIVACLADAISDEAVSQAIRARVVELVRPSRKRRASKLTCGLSFAHTDRAEVADFAEYLCSVVADAAEECATVVAQAKQIRERLTKRLQALVDEVRPAA